VRMKKTLAAAAAIALLGVTSACGSDDEKPADGGPKTADLVVWLNGADTPQAARDWLKKTFEEENPGSTLTIEEQQWDGLVERLTTALSSEDQTPDVVEVGNTQAPTFTTAGAFSDLTGDLSGLGGDDLLQGFVEGATIDGKTFAVPYYAGSTYVFYRKDLLKQAKLEVPTTMEDFIDTAIALKKQSGQKDFSGYWLPGQDWRDGAAFLWNAGGDFAAGDGEEWEGSLSTAESIEGLTTYQKLFKEASGAPADANEEDPVTPFCAGKIGMMSRPGWVYGMLTDPKSGCPDLAKQVGVFALPGSDGEPAPVLLGGSDIAVSAKSPNQDLARKAIALMLSDDYQGILAENGLTPARDSLASLLGDDEFAQATIAAASNAKLTPAAANWATVEGTRVLEDLFSQIAQDGDVEDLAADADEQITEELQR
jgi:N,N'-diacetylchitobiose transport system substrate-binding protein